MSKEVKDKASVRKRGLKELVLGAVVAAAGILASVASYNNAKPGQTYTVYTGFIVLGVVYAIKGIYDLAFPAGILSKNKKANNEEVIEAKTAEKAEVVEEDD